MEYAQCGPLIEEYLRGYPKPLTPDHFMRCIRDNYVYSNNTIEIRTADGVRLASGHNVEPLEIALSDRNTVTTKLTVKREDHDTLCFDFWDYLSFGTVRRSYNMRSRSSFVPERLRAEYHMNY
jgi:hypothetical protein